MKVFPHIFGKQFYSTQQQRNLVRVRFAPSPTGELHLGSLRTALFNYLYAKSHNGTFVLRVEDTDRERLVQGCEEKFEDTLGYFGLNVDESPNVGGSFAPYRQSERIETYKDAANQLIDSGHAYKCFCTPKRLEILRKKCLGERITPRYDLLCRNLPKSEVNSRERDGEVPVIRFKFDPGEMAFKDMVFGNSTYKWGEADFIIMKQDGFPTYHFANVVDDHHMQITDVIRGCEWLISTPKHLEIYRAFNWSPPNFAHLPLITQDGHKKLSKSKSSSYINHYTNLGYLPLAILNFLLRNGSGIRGHDKNNLYTLEEMVQNFDVNLIVKNSFMMDMKELDRYGRMSFHKATFTELLPSIKHQFSLLDKETRDSINSDLLKEDYFKKVIVFLQKNEEAFGKLSDITCGDFRFFFMMPKSADKLMGSFSDIEQTIDLLEEFIHNLKMDNFTYNELKMLAEKKGIEGSQMAKLIRLTIIDNVSGPPISEIVEFFGKKEIEKRSNWMIDKLNESKRTMAI